MDKGNFILSGIGKESVLRATELAVEMQEKEDFGTNVPDYVEKKCKYKGCKNNSKLCRNRELNGVEEIIA